MSAITWKDFDDSSFGFAEAFGSGSIASVTRWTDEVFEWNAPIPRRIADGHLYGGRHAIHTGIAKTLEDAKLFVAIELAMWIFRARPVSTRLAAFSRCVENHSNSVNKSSENGITGGS